MLKKFFTLIFIFIFASLYSYDLNFDVESGIFYNNYIKNETYQYLSTQITLTSFEAIQKIRMKLIEKLDEIKLNFDGRFYLKPDQNKFEYIIDSAYFAFENGPFMLYAGKQRIKWGTGYTWNPTDKLQSGKNILDPTKDLEGFYALRLEYSNDFLTPSLIIAPEPQPVDKDPEENFRFAMQFYKLTGAADFFVNAIYQMNNLQTIGSAISWDTEFCILNFEVAAIRYVNSNLCVSRKLGLTNDKIEYSFLAGLNKTIESSLFISVEYYYNGWGITNYQFNDYVNIYKISEIGIKNNYFSLNFSWTWDEKISFSIVSIYGADDSMILFYPRIEYVESSNFNVEIGFVENITDKNKESYYTMPVYNITNLKLKAYF